MFFFSDELENKEWHHAFADAEHTCSVFSSAARSTEGTTLFFVPNDFPSVFVDPWMSDFTRRLFCCQITIPNLFHMCRIFNCAFQARPGPWVEFQLLSFFVFQKISKLWDLREELRCTFMRCTKSNIESSSVRCDQHVQQTLYFQRSGTNFISLSKKNNHEYQRTKGLHTRRLEMRPLLGFDAAPFYSYFTARIVLSPVHCVPSMLSTLCADPLVLIDVVSSLDPQISVSLWDSCSTSFVSNKLFLSTLFFAFFRYLWASATNDVSSTLFRCQTNLYCFQVNTLFHNYLCENLEDFIDFCHRSCLSLTFPRLVCVTLLSSLSSCWFCRACCNVLICFSIRYHVSHYVIEVPSSLIS